MRIVLLMVLAFGCKGEAKPEPKTETQIAKEYEDATVAALTAKWDGLDVRVGDRTIQIVAATCAMVLPVVQGIKLPPPPHQVVQCGMENSAPDWNLFEHFGEMKRAQ